VVDVPCEYISVTENQTPTQALKDEIQQLRQTVKQQDDILDGLRSALESEAVAIINGLEPGAKKINTDSTAKEGKKQQSPRVSPALIELVEVLQSPHAQLAIEAFCSLRQGMTPETILRSIRGDVSSYTAPSLHDTNKGILPPTRTCLEFQLTVQHPNVYPPLAPLDVATLDLQLLGIKSFNTLGQPSRDRLPPSSSWAISPNSTVNPGSITELTTDRSSTIALDLRDVRLDNIEIRLWTDVVVSNRFAAEAISLYLEMNQPWWAFFDVDQFLEDLISGETQFCSRLLVNALLAWACVCHVTLSTTDLLSDASF
jgi:hypothetical protein